MILFGLTALDQVPSRHFFIVSCETTRMGIGLIRSKLAVRPGGYSVWAQSAAAPGGF
jgi:hypothetical protein